MLQISAADPPRTDEQRGAALSAAKAALDAQEASISASVTNALKQAFTLAVRRVYFLGLFFILAGFIVTLFLPELALRKTVGHAPSASASASAEG